jgi:hypothetical protein
MIRHKNRDGISQPLLELCSFLPHMRRIFLLGFVVILIFLTGCTQTPTSPATPAGSVVVLTAPTTVPVTTSAVVAGQMQLNVTASQSGQDVIVTYNGGPSAAYLTALNITIYNQNGQVVTRTMESPTSGDVYTFPYAGTPDPDNVDVVGVFTGGVEQTVLMTTV